MQTTTEPPGSPRAAIPDRPTFREWRPVLLITLAAILLWIPFFAHTRQVALADPDSQDYAQVAIHVAEGRGFQTYTKPLCALAWEKETGRLGEWWDLHRFPLPSLIMAGLFGIFGATTLAVSLSSALFFFANIPLIFLFGRRLFDARAGVLSAFLFAFVGGAFEDSVSGRTEMAAIFFFVAALYLVLWPRRAWDIPLAGALTGLAFLNRSSTVLYAVPMLFLVARARERRAWLNLLAFCLPGAVVAAPWLVRNYLLTGNPMFSFTTALMLRFKTAVSPESHDWYRFYYEDPGHFLRNNPVLVLKKFIRQSYELWKFFPQIGATGLVMPFFFASLFRRYEGRRESLRRWLLLVFVLHAAAIGLLSNIPRYYVLFGPFMLMYAADMILTLWDAVRPRVTALQAVVIGIVALPVFFGHLAQVIRPASDPVEDVMVMAEAHPANLDFIRARAPKDAVLLADQPWSIGWHIRRRALLLPWTVAEVARFADYGVRPFGIYIRNPEPLGTRPPTWEQWRRVQKGAMAVPGFHRVHTFPDGAAYYERNP